MGDVQLRLPCSFLMSMRRDESVMIKVDTDTASPVQLTEAQRKSMNARAVRGMMRALAAQGAMAIAGAIIAWVVGGTAAAASALAGAGAYWLPNAAFGLRLMFGLLAGRSASPVFFFLGEMLKLAATVFLLWLLSRFASEWLVWPAVIGGLILTLKGYFLLMMFRKLS